MQSSLYTCTKKQELTNKHRPFGGIALLNCLSTLFSSYPLEWGWRFSCRQLRHVLIVLELAPLALRKLKDDNKTRGIQKSTPFPPGRGERWLSKMARAPEGEIFLDWRHDVPFHLCRLRKDGEERKVIQFHYTEWPCHSNPFSNALLEFRRRVRQVMNQHPETQDGPVIVHCK